MSLSLRHVPFDRQIAVRVAYRGVAVGEGRADLVVGERTVVELKALPALGPAPQVSPTSKPWGCSSGCS
jgi:GxxExxY protein